MLYTVGGGGGGESCEGPQRPGPVVEEKGAKTGPDFPRRGGRRQAGRVLFSDYHCVLVRVTQKNKTNR